MSLNKFILCVIGLGALGSPVIKKAAKLGFSEVRVIDGDVISEKNRINQSIYRDFDISRPLFKSDAIVSMLSREYSNTKFLSFPEYATETNIDSLIGGADLVLDFTDNTLTRLIINKACVKKSIPLFIGSINDSAGFYYLISNAACFNCIYKNASSRMKEGCDSNQPIPPESFVDEIVARIVDIKNGVEEPEFVSLRFDSGEKVSTKLSKDPLCSVCSLGDYSPIKTDNFIQVCGDGIKFSAQREIDILKLRDSIGGEIIDGKTYLLRASGKSILISRLGDCLFTGYSKEGAQKFIDAYL